MYTIFGAAFDKKNNHFAASPEDFEFARDFYGLTENLLHQGKLRTHPESLQPGGLQGVLKGMQDLKDGSVTGKKLVYRVADTPHGSSAEAKF